MLALPCSLVFLLLFALVSAQSSSSVPSSSARSASASQSSSASASNVPSASVTRTLTSVTLTDASGLTTIIPITVTPSSSASHSGSATSTASFPSLTGYSSCVVDCLTHAVSAANCSSVTDVNCFCESSVFPPSYESCVETSCASDLPSATSLANQFCAVSSPSTSISFTSPTSTPTSSGSSTRPSSSTPSSTTSQSASSSASSNAAAAQRGIGGTQGGLATAGISILGSILGALLV
ncbi:hypothetical protein HETIRDRAFT_442683 [Heterobasidion irregulare TC 32-1]|uniref:CFEM domain-containing protein n=1 Tax=Heterobasidion irregulare (strain TC 32-1) TaxID=747525 RepID=W4JNT6_HETIT|nr:uncharacterized protein HETIRDRAFT_442683 [Heterobasidion irregulare TC 32-1]ETW74725.1 hypothetical protein HETIRDRAFT_442683 [Heterobasidion irregulare TC 32-1]